MKRQEKILILVPSDTARGGITNYYQVLRNELSGSCEYFKRGSRNWPYRKGFAAELLRAINDYKNFKKRIVHGDVALVQTTTSLSFATTIRDGLFIRYALRKGIKAIVFFRGWEESAMKNASKYLLLFKYFFFNANALITLSEKAKAQLLQWGYKKDIFVETTTVAKNFMDIIDESLIKEKYSSLSQNHIIHLLFLSRIESKKGIYDLLEAYALLVQSAAQSSFSYSLTICGDGFEQENISKYIIKTGLKNINIKGFIESNQKLEAYRNANLFIFPSFTEGMPNSVLEAMGAGLPVLTTPVGGIVDFFEPDKHGFFIEPGNPEDICNKIRKLSEDLNLMYNMSLNNFRLANMRFRSDVVAKRILGIFSKVLND